MLSSTYIDQNRVALLQHTRAGVVMGERSVFTEADTAERSLRPVLLVEILDEPRDFQFGYARASGRRKPPSSPYR